jgi:quercetin dioxygenase-like cupin family protein
MTKERSAKNNKNLVLVFLGLMTGTSMAQAADVTPLIAKDLTDIPGREVMMITVEKAPGGADPIHRHNAQGFIYVLEGSIVMQVDGGKEVTLTPGQTFYEGPDDIHVVGRNASNTKPVKFLVFLVKDKGAPVLVTSNLATGEQRENHQTISGVVTTAAGGLAIKTPQGATYQVNENLAKRHGHEPFKDGDHVRLVLNENNTLIEVHPEGQEGEHQYVTGKLIHLGKMQNEIKLATPEGEKVFPLATLEAKTKGINEGTAVTVEVNEVGTVIDVHRATGGAVKP